MVRKTYLPEQIINKLREAEVLLSQGATTALQRQTSSDSSPCVPATLALDEPAASAKVDTKPHLSLTSVH